MAKYIGKGADISFGPTAAGPWTKIPQVESIGELRSQSAQVNVSDLDSLEEEFIAGIKSPQTIACSAIWDPNNAVHQTVRDDAEDGTVLFFKYQWRNTASSIIATAIHAGFYSEIAFGPTALAEALKLPFTIQRSGAVSWT